MAQKSTTAATATPAEGVGPGKVFPPLDHTTFVPQLVWLAISFGLLYLLLSRVALPRVGEVIEERADRIRRDLDQAEKLKVETEGALAAYEQALTEARSKAGGIIKTMRDGLTAEVDKERARVEARDRPQGRRGRGPHRADQDAGAGRRQRHRHRDGRRHRQEADRRRRHPGRAAEGAGPARCGVGDAPCFRRERPSSGSWSRSSCSG